MATETFYPGTQLTLVYSLKERLRDCRNFVLTSGGLVPCPVSWELDHLESLVPGCRRAECVCAPCGTRNDDDPATQAPGYSQHRGFHAASICEVPRSAHEHPQWQRGAASPNTTEHLEHSQAIRLEQALAALLSSFPPG